MTLRDARDMAIKFGAKLPRFDPTTPVAECWIDRVMWLPRAATPARRARGHLDGRGA
jgi:hypothetical protein